MSIIEDIDGKTVAGGFLETVGKHGDLVALRDKRDGSWVEWTWNDYADKVGRIAAGLRELGVGPGDRVVLMMRNQIEFHAVDMAVLMLGAAPVSIYNSSSPDQIEYLVGHCEAVVAVVGDDSFLDRFTPVRDSLPKLRSIGVVNPGNGSADFTWDDLLAHEPLDLAVEVQTGEPDDLVTVIYTSGTTGPPKGVMITNTNAVFMVASLKHLVPIPDEEIHDKRIISYLPMAHIAERTVSHYQHVLRGFEVSCCPDPTQIAAFAGEVRPHLMFGVPRVFEKIYAGVMAVVGADPEKAKSFEEAIAASRDIALRRSWGTATEEDEATWSFLDEVAFKGIRELVGMDQMLSAISGAAPIPAELLLWFRAIGVPMSEVYGMSENTGAMTWTAEKIKPGSVGPAVPGTEVKIADDGEVLCRGPHVFAGYLNDPDKTAETIVDGWLHSGDIGEIDDDGYLTIIDRKKELIITAGGKNISPANLEGALKMIPLVGQAAVIGDRRPFVSALVVLDPDTAKAWAAQNGLGDLSLKELADHPDVQAEIESHLPEAMEGFNNAERVKKVKVLGEEWLPDSELLTPTSKLKRRGIMATFGDEIESLYA